MFRTAIFAVLAIALSSSAALARQVAGADTAESIVEFTPVMRAAFGQQAVGTASAAALVISAEAVLSGTSPNLVPLAGPVEPESSLPKPRNAPWWATTLAVAGPLADGLSTMYAIGQSGPRAQVVEGNAFYSKLFGANVKPGEIMAFKVAQAAFMGYVVHAGGRYSQEKAIATALLQSAVNFFVASRNMRSAATAKRLNAGAPR